MNIDAEKVMLTLKAQRNEALDNLAIAQAVIETLQAQLTEKKDEPNG